MCVCVSICEYRDSATSRETRDYERFDAYEHEPPESRTLNDSRESSVSEAWSRVAGTPPSRTRGTSRSMQMLDNKWPWPSDTKSLLLPLWKSAKTETLPNVPAGHAELRTDNSAATIDGASDGTKGWMKGTLCWTTSSTPRARFYLRETLKAFSELTVRFNLWRVGLLGFVFGILSFYYLGFVASVELSPKSSECVCVPSECSSQGSAGGTLPTATMSETSR